MKFLSTVISMLALIIISSGSVVKSVALAADTSSIGQPTLSKILRGTTGCTKEDGQSCGKEYWTVYVHSDQSRTMHIAWETGRNNEVRHVLITADADGSPSEAFLHDRNNSGLVGSSYVLLDKDGAFETTNDTGFDDAPDAVKLARKETDQPAFSVSTGPSAADGLHFLKYDFEKAGEQARNIYWMGGSHRGTMSGQFRGTSHTFLGEEDAILPDGSKVLVDHFLMMSGSEIWLTKEDRVVVRMDPKFGGVSAGRHDLTQYEEILIVP